MTPEEQIAELTRQVKILLEWKEERDRQQIRFPIDEASLATIGGYRDEGAGVTALTEVYSVSGGAGGSVTAPKAYIATRIIICDGERIEVPVLSFP